MISKPSCGITSGKRRLIEGRVYSEETPDGRTVSQRRLVTIPTSYTLFASSVASLKQNRGFVHPSAQALTGKLLSLEIIAADLDKLCWKTQFPLKGLNYDLVDFFFFLFFILDFSLICFFYSGKG